MQFLDTPSNSTGIIHSSHTLRFLQILQTITVTINTCIAIKIAIIISLHEHYCCADWCKFLQLKQHQLSLLLILSPHIDRIVCSTANGNILPTQYTLWWIPTGAIGVMSWLPGNWMNKPEVDTNGRSGRWWRWLHDILPGRQHWWTIRILLSWRVQKVNFLNHIRVKSYKVRVI